MDAVTFGYTTNSLWSNKVKNPEGTKSDPQVKAIHTPSTDYSSFCLIPVASSLRRDILVIAVLHIDDLT